MRACRARTYFMSDLIGCAPDSSGLGFFCLRFLPTMRRGDGRRQFRSQKFAHIWVTTCFRDSPKKPLILTFFENIENMARTTHSMCCPTRRSIIERSALARCNMLIIRSKKDQGQRQERPRTKTTKTTTCRHQHTTPHHTNKARAHDMTRQGTTKKQRHTRTRTCICTRTCI